MTKYKRSYCIYCSLTILNHLFQILYKNLDTKKMTFKIHNYAEITGIIVVTEIYKIIECVV